MNFFANDAVPKRLGLLHELVPKASRVAMFTNPNDFATLRVEVPRAQDSGCAIGLSISVLRASTDREIEQAFATMVREGIVALLVTGSGYFASRRIQLATLAGRYRIAAAYANRAIVEVGGLMSYGTDLAHMFHQVGAYAGKILKGTNPADLPVVQSTDSSSSSICKRPSARHRGVADIARYRRRGNRMRRRLHHRFGGSGGG